MVLVSIRILLPLQKHGEVLKTLRLISERNRIQNECLSSRLYGDLNEEGTIMMEEVWQCQEALEHYLRSEECRILLLLMEMALERPEVKFHAIASSTGIEAIEKARSKLRRDS